MPVHDWTRVDAGIFHHFHTALATHLAEMLNGGVLPHGYYALAEQRVSLMMPDVLTLRTERPIDASSFAGGVAVAEAPPKVRLRAKPDALSSYRTRARRVAIRHISRHQVVATIEIVSPASKDRPETVAQFAAKIANGLDGGVHAFVIDLFPPGRFDPQGMHGAIWERYDAAGYQPPADGPLTLASYSAGGDEPLTYVQPIAAGGEIIVMPLFLSADRYVDAPLPSAYHAAFAGMPDFYRVALSKP